jgi:predicted transposase YbfD/YdcC
MDFVKHFSGITDYRDQSKISHLLTDIVGLCLLGTIADCDSYQDIEDFGKHNELWLRKYLQLPNGIPSHDTMERMFIHINPVEFNSCFINWVQSSFKFSATQLLHLDGKSNRSIMDSYRGKKMLHAVSVFVGKNKLSLSQSMVEEKSNEITAIEPLLETLDIKDKTITIDAMGCQKEIAGYIAEQNAYYILAVKDNQKTLHQQIETAFSKETLADTASTLEKDHGRIEERTCSVITDLKFIDEAINWKALYCVIRLISTRTINGVMSTQTRYFISNNNQLAKFFLYAIRSHWEIENSLHWVLDMVFKEDLCRKRKHNAAENFNFIRKMALNIIRQKNDKKSLRRRRKEAARSTNYLADLLTF